jgi:predicted extracellular nuclease
MKFIFLICFSFILVCGLSFVCFGNVIINEIMARPLDDESMNEWIELYNNDSQNIDLKNYSMERYFEKDALVGPI